MKTSFNFRAFLNFLKRNKLYTAINIIGFSVSLTFVILLVGYSLNELSTDQFHANKNRIFLLTDENDDSSFACPIGQDLKNRYPEIESFCRIISEEMTLIRQDKKIAAQVLMVDSTFFTMFSFPLAEGSADRALKSKYGALLSESFARKLFGDEDPMGKELKLGKLQVNVEGVVRDFQGSHIGNPDVILRFDTGMSRNEDNKLTSYGDSSFGLYLMTYPQADLSRKTDDMVSFFKTYFWTYETGLVTQARLMPLTDVYFEGSMFLSLLHNGNRTLTTVFLSVALLILLFAMINYVNLSVAQAGFRAPEMGTRRLLGSSRGALFGRLILESVILCAFSFCLSLLLTRLIQGPFNRMLNTDFSVFSLFSGETIGLMIALVLLLGLVTGFVPALIMSRFKPIEIVRGEFKRKTKAVYGKVLIGFQYLITIVLIGCSLVMYRQIRFMTNADLGYDTDNILIIEKVMGRSKAETFRNEIAKVSGVELVSLATWTPFDGGNNNSGTYDDKPISFQVFYGDSLFFKLLDLSILRDNHSAITDAVWLNETAMRAMNLPDTASSFNWWKERAIAGIVKDFNFRDFTEQVGPAMLEKLDEKSWIRRTLVKISGGNLASARGAIEKIYGEFTGGEPFNARFSEEIIQKRYEQQRRTADLLAFFTVIAVLISALGILAMATYFIQQRSLEIAVRKVFGSTRTEVLRLLVLRFIRIVAVAFVIAVPLIWYLMSDWLSTYTYRIGMNWDIFLLAGGFAVIIALLTVLSQSYKAASANPVDSVKR